MKSTAEATVGKSRNVTDSTIRRPMPGQPKMDSVITAPPKRFATSSAHAVTTGIIAFFSTCFAMTIRSGTPFALAVRT
jgi:hypothetical protein